MDAHEERMALMCLRKDKNDVRNENTVKSTRCSRWPDRSLASWSVVPRGRERHHDPLATLTRQADPALPAAFRRDGPGYAAGDGHVRCGDWRDPRSPGVGLPVRLSGGLGPGDGGRDDGAHGGLDASP